MSVAGYGRSQQPEPERPPEMQMPSAPAAVPLGPGAYPHSFVTTSSQGRQLVARPVQLRGPTPSQPEPEMPPASAQAGRQPLSQTGRPMVPWITPQTPSAQVMPPHGLAHLVLQQPQQQQQPLQQQQQQQPRTQMPSQWQSQSLMVGAQQQQSQQQQQQRHQQQQQPRPHIPSQLQPQWQVVGAQQQQSQQQHQQQRQQHQARPQMPSQLQSQWQVVGLRQQQQQQQQQPQTQP